MKHRRQVPQHPSFVQWDQGAFRDDRWRPADLSPPLVSATPCRRRRGVLSAQDMTLKSASTDKSALARIQENQHHLRTAKPKISQPSSPLPVVPMAGTSLCLGFGPAGGDSTFFSTPGVSTGHCRSRRQGLCRTSYSPNIFWPPLPRLRCAVYLPLRSQHFRALAFQCWSLLLSLQVAISSLLYPPGWLFALFLYISFIFISTSPCCCRSAAAFSPPCHGSPAPSPALPADNVPQGRLPDRAALRAVLGPAAAHSRAIASPGTSMPRSM